MRDASAPSLFMSLVVLRRNRAPVLRLHHPESRRVNRRRKICDPVPWCYPVHDGLNTFTPLTFFPSICIFAVRINSRTRGYTSSPLSSMNPCAALPGAKVQE